MAKTLQELRKEAGYKSAKDFAEAIGMSESTYSRYESNPDNINMKAAIKLADFLHCSLDMVMGREPVNIEDMRGDVQKFYDSLSDDNRKLFDEFSSFILDKEEKVRQEKKRLEQAQYDDYVRYYDRLFTTKAEEDPYLHELLVFGAPSERRAHFQEFLEQRALEKRMVDADLVEENDFQSLISEELTLHDMEHMNEPPEEVPPCVIDESNLRVKAHEAAQHYFTEKEKEDHETIERIMEAYDRLYVFKDNGFTYGIVTWNDDE